MTATLVRAERHRPVSPAATLPAVLAATVVAEQIAYPLLHGQPRAVLTVAVVVTLALTCTVHAVVTRGLRAAGALLALTAVPGFAVEALGVHTGVPFGGYRYADVLGPQFAGVPVLIAFAWTMLAWPAVLAARALVRSRGARILVGAWALTAADLFLDPQMVDAGYWTWRHPSPHLPGVPTVPLTNLAGWLLVAVLMSAALNVALDRFGVTTDADLVPHLLYLWLYVGWIVALAVFGRLPAAAGWGALGMGVVALPLAARVMPRAIHGLRGPSGR